MADRAEPIRGKVAKVLNSREVALNIGEEQGVRIGMVFEILSPVGDVIEDPDTGDTLGSVDIWTAVQLPHGEYNHTFRPMGEDFAIPAGLP